MPDPRHNPYVHLCHEMWSDLARVFAAAMCYGGHVRYRIDVADASRFLRREHTLLCAAVQGANFYGLGAEVREIMRKACRQQLASARRSGTMCQLRAKRVKAASGTIPGWLERSQP